MIPIIYLQLFKLDQIFVTNRSSKRVVPWGYLSYTQQKELDMYIKQITACNIQLLLLDNDKMAVGDINAKEECFYIQST